MPNIVKLQSFFVVELKNATKKSVFLLFFYIIILYLLTVYVKEKECNIAF